MKKLIPVIVLALFGAVPAFGQNPTYSGQIIANVPSTLAAVTQTNFPFATAPIIPVGKQKTVALEITGRLSDLGTNLQITLAPSVSGVYYDTNTAGKVAANVRLITISFTNSTTPITVVTNLEGGAIGYWKIMSIYNTHATETWTNLGMYYSVKQSAP